LWGASLESLGFEVSYLADQQATRAALVTALQDLVGSLGAGDVSVFQYAGHGSQVPDDSGDETDAFDEVIVPVDYHSGALLLDDDLAEIVSRVPPGARLVLFMDCCHSGTNSRFAPPMRAAQTSDERVRYLPLSAEVQAAFLARGDGARARLRTAKEKAVAGVIHFAACQDDEYAWESQGQGDFTAAAAPLLAAAVARGDSGETFLRAVRATVAGRGRQHPQLMPTVDGLERHPLLSKVRSRRYGVRSTA
jgi:hypothetical protein